MLDDAGDPLDATFHLEEIDASAHTASLRFESRGGKPPRNGDYNPALELLLQRLGRVHATLVRVELDTANTRHLPPADRLVEIDEAAYEIELYGRDDYKQLRIGLGRGAGRICQKPPGNKGGNIQRQVRLHLRFPENQRLSKPWLERVLRQPPQSTQPYTYAEPNADGAIAQDEFVPTSTDTRTRALRDVPTRPGQTAFRNKLIDSYGPRCVVSGAEVIEALEAAHISSYRGEQDNHTANGILLRADLHKLYDANLLGIDPDGLIVHIRPRAAVGEYAQYEGRALLVEGPERLSKEALRERWLAFVRDDGPTASE